jgi:hypothetical protein
VRYAVVWSENGGSLHAGGLELDSSSLQPTGTAPSKGASRRRLPHEGLDDARIERRTHLRLAGRPTPVLAFRDGGRLCLASIESVGSLHELAEQLEAGRRNAA